jgi:hypothetical protein
MAKASIAVLLSFIGNAPLLAFLTPVFFGDTASGFYNSFTDRKRLHGA